MKPIFALTAAVAALGVALPLAAGAAGDDAKGGYHAANMADGFGRHRDHDRGYGGRHGDGGADRHGMRALERLLDRFDANGDGSVTQPEIDATRADRLASFDSDGDGQLSLAEYEALWLDAMRERMVDQFQRHDDDGDGQVTVTEFGKRMGRLVELRDRNGDGALNVEDLRGSPGAGRRHSERSED